MNTKLRYGLCVTVGIAIGVFAARNTDRIYLEGMFVDHEIVSALTTEKRITLEQLGVYHLYAKYSNGSDAYTVDSLHPPYVSIHAGLWSDDFSTIQGSSLSMKGHDEEGVLKGSGIAFHTIDGKLYAYSAGSIRDTPDKYSKLIDELIDQSVALNDIINES